MHDPIFPYEPPFHTISGLPGSSLGFVYNPVSATASAEAVLYPPISRSSWLLTGGHWGDTGTFNDTAVWDDGFLRQAVVDLSSAQILALHDSPVTIIPAPGVGKAIIVRDVFHEFTDGTNPIYGSAQAFIGYDNGDINYKFCSNSYSQTYTKFYSGDLFVFSSAGGGCNFAAIDNKAIKITGPNFSLGSIATSTLGAGGSGYAIGDTGFLNSSGYGDAEYTVDTVDGGGAVLTYHLSNAGTGYLTETGAPTTASTGIGTGLTINVTAVTPGNGTAKISFTYHIVSKP